MYKSTMTIVAFLASLALATDAWAGSRGGRNVSPNSGVFVDGQDSGSGNDSTSRKGNVKNNWHADDGNRGSNAFEDLNNGDPSESDGNNNAGDY